MFSWGRRRDAGESKEIKEMEAMIAAMTSASLTSFGNEDEDVGDEGDVLEAELAELMGTASAPRVSQTAVSKYRDEDPEGVQLEPEDENDPELLAELSSLSPHPIDVSANDASEARELVMHSNDVVEDVLEVRDELQNVQESVFDTEPIVTTELLEVDKHVAAVAQGEIVGGAVSSGASEQTPIEKQIVAARMLALKYKRAGDMEAAKDVLKMMKQLEGSQKTSTPPTQRKSPPVEEFVATKSKHQVTINKQLAMERLQEQAGKALRASKLYELQKQSALSQSFKQRTRTILNEIDALKKSAESTVHVAEVPVSYDVVTPSIKDIRPDELHLGIAQIKAEGFGEEACWSFQCTLDSQEKCTAIGALNPRTYHDVIFGGLNRDLRLLKFFEHRKLRLELLRHEPGLFGSLLGRRGVGQAFGVSAQIKLDSLLKEPSSIETVPFACKNKRYSLQADISLKVNTPIGSKALQRIKETWITLKTEQQEEEAEMVARKASLPGMLPGTIPMEELVSYSVLEEELKGIASLPMQTRSHPAIMTRQLQLESARDLLALRVQIGELSQEDYARTVGEAVVKFKKQAIAAKKAGDLPLAKAYLGYSKVMERELVEAEEEGDGEG